MVFKALEFLRLVNGERTLSLTAISLITVLAKIAVCPALGVQEAIALGAALSAYMGNRVVNEKSFKKAELERVNSNVSWVSNQASRSESELQKIARELEELKSRSVSTEQLNQMKMSIDSLVSARTMKDILPKF